MPIPALALYLSLVLTFAALVVTHAALVVRVVRTRGLEPARKALAALPPATPIVAWRAGARVGPVLWTALALAYAVLVVIANA